MYSSKNKLHALEMEDYFINLFETKGSSGYNITRGGQQGPPKGTKRKPLSEEQLLRRRERMKDPELRRKISEGVRACEGRGANISKSKIGKPRSAETIEKMKISNRGKGSARQKEVAREIMKGNTHAKGLKHTEEYKQMMSDFMKNRDHSYKCKKVTC